MPEAAMYKNYGFVFWQNNIRFAGKVFIVEFITVAICEKKFSHEHHRLCVLAFDPAHIVTSYFFGMHICHCIKLPK